MACRNGSTQWSPPASPRQISSPPTFLRRLIWSLNDESGGIGWGNPEAMGEILARQPALAREYAAILISYVRPGENFLQFGPLQRGALWGRGAPGGGPPRACRHLRAGRYLEAYLNSPDPMVKGHALWAGARVRIEGNLAGNRSPVGRGVRDHDLRKSEVQVRDHRRAGSKSSGEVGKQPKGLARSR